MSARPARPLFLAAAFSVAMGLPGVVPSAQAATYRVDDTASVVDPPLASMRWRQPVPGRGADHTVEAQLRVALRLNLAPWLGRPARLYLRLAPTEGESLQVSWRGQGRLMAGSLQGGARALVLDGLVRQAILNETLLIDLRADGRALDRPRRLEFVFEIEVNP